MIQWLREMSATYLAVLGMILIALWALLLAMIVICISHEAEVIKAALTISAIAGSIATLLGGFIGGYEIGKRSMVPAPVPAKPDSAPQIKQTEE
jgi:uncharacterized membrane protein